MKQTISKDEFIKMINKDFASQRWEAERKSKLLNLFLTEITLFLLLYVGFYFILYIFNTYMDILLFRLAAVGLGLIYLLAFICFCTNPFLYNKDFKDELKKSYKKNIKYFFTLTGFGKNGFAKGALQLSNLFPKFEKMEYDDCLKGTYNNVNFSVAETVLSDIQHFDRYNPEFTVFKGVIISLDLNKKNKSETIVKSKGDFSICNRFNIWSILLISSIPIIFFLPLILTNLKYWLSHPFIMIAIVIFPLTVLLTLFLITWLRDNYLLQKSSMYTVRLEDVKFAKKYDVLSDDEIEARYLITTAFMERLQNLQTAFGTNNIKCSFFEDKLIFAISTNKDLFELGSLWRPFGKDLEDFYNQIISIYEMIDYFKLNERTGL